MDCLWVLGKLQPFFWHDYDIQSYNKNFHSIYYVLKWDILGRDIQVRVSVFELLDPASKQQFYLFFTYWCMCYVMTAQHVSHILRGFELPFILPFCIVLVFVQHILVNIILISSDSCCLFFALWTCLSLPLFCFATETTHAWKCVHTHEHTSSFQLCFLQ